MIDLKIGHIWLINSINWPIRRLSTCKMIKKALKKGKNNIFYARLKYISEIHRKKIISIVDDIDSNLTKICFCESYINIKITKNSSIKPILKVTTKLNRLYIDL